MKTARNGGIPYHTICTGSQARRWLERFGNRGYRTVQLEAGILGGKFYLAAYAQRLGATGVTFYDDEVVEFFSPHARGKSAIFVVAVGRGARPAR